MRFQLLTADRGLDEVVHEGLIPMIQGYPIVIMWHGKPYFLGNLTSEHVAYYREVTMNEIKDVPRNRIWYSEKASAARG